MSCEEGAIINLRIIIITIMIPIKINIGIVMAFKMHISLLYTFNPQANNEIEIITNPVMPIDYKTFVYIFYSIFGILSISSHYG